VASLYLTEFQASGNAESGAQLQVGVQPAVTGRRRPSGIFLFGHMGHRDPRY